MSPTLTRPPTVEILVRSFHGHERQLRSNLLPTLAAFVNRREFPFTVVLDDESEADHDLGARLSGAGLCDAVAYEPLPADWRRLFQGVAFPPPRNHWGYDRQQWSTFYMDTHSDRDVLGIVDSDATFYSYLTRKNIFAEDGRIILGVYRPTPGSYSNFVRRYALWEGGCAYRNDRVALQEEIPYECMYTNRMPIWFWRSTFAACRNHIARIWNTRFDAAFEDFSRALYSTFNILANYALRHEPDKYVARLMDSPEGDILCVGENGCMTPLDLVAGGLQTFRVARDEPLPDPIKRAYSRLIVDTRHLNRWAYNLCGVKVSRERARQHYATVRVELSQLPPEQQNAMRHAFLDLVHHGLQNVMVTEVPAVGTWDRAERKIRFWFKNHPGLKAAALWLTAQGSRSHRLIRRWIRR